MLAALSLWRMTFSLKQENKEKMNPEPYIASLYSVLLASTSTKWQKITRKGRSYFCIINLVVSIRQIGRVNWKFCLKILVNYIFQLPEVILCVIFAVSDYLFDIFSPRVDYYKIKDFKYTESWIRSFLFMNISQSIKENTLN